MDTLTLYIVTCDTVTECGLAIGFIEHLHTQLVTNSNYIAITDSHTLQFTTARAKSFQSAVSSPVVAGYRLQGQTSPNSGFPNYLRVSITSF
jgi:hypothetical protein